MVCSAVELLDFFKELLDAAILTVQLLLHLLQLALFVDATDDFVDVQLKTHVTLVVQTVTHYL